MPGLKSSARALASACILAAVAVPAVAREHIAPTHHAVHSQDWRNARAQAIPEGEGVSMSRERAAAIRECNEKAAPLKDYTWGDEQFDEYRACMTEYGQPE